MLFNSYIFVLIFLPLCIVVYYSLNRIGKIKPGIIWLLLMSLYFYGYNNVNYLMLMLFSICLNYAVYYLLLRFEKENVRKFTEVTGIVLNIGILFYFKYYDFFIENWNSFFKTNMQLLQIALPLGISFFTFQQISFIVDAYRKEVPKYDFISYAAFVSFFPQLIAGPIVTHDELIPQFLDETKKKINWDNFAKGMYVFALGMAKKVLLADTFSKAVDYGFENIALIDSTNAILVMLCYTFQIYFDFSGYCDMAIGIGKMLNIELPQNFNSPYQAQTITDFWKRWHMTLTRFLTQYVYIPLGGNRKGTVRTYINITLVYLISGIWHGANWTFILWGGATDLCPCSQDALERRFRRYRLA